MIVTGNVGEDFRKVYGVVLDAQERAIAAIRPGVTAKAVDTEARSAIERGGFGGRFGHGLGHGIGLAIHESPSLRPDSEDILRPGMVLTVEPGIYLPRWGGIRIEDDVLVTAEGCEVLTNLPKSIDSLFTF
jgi:Xaa-Pro aminopeptidase